MNISRLVALAMAALLAFSWPVQAASENVLPPAQVKFGDLIRDLQRIDSPGNQLEMVWWMPPQYLEASFAQSQNASIDAKTARQFIDLFTRYTVVAAVRGEVGGLGMDSYASEEELRSKLKILDSAGQSYTPVPADKLDPKMSLIISILRPMFKQMIGELGNNLQIFVFPGKRPDGGPVADALGNGQFLVQLGDNQHRFRLPVASLLKPRVDPASGDSFPGSYNFNPYTGSALQAAP